MSELAAFEAITFTRTLVHCCGRRPTNSQDRYAEHVKKDEVTIGLFAGIISRNSVRLLPCHGRKHSDLTGTAPPGCTSCTTHASVTGRHFTIHYGYSEQRNGKQERSLGVRKPISLFKISKKSHCHSLATLSTPHMSKLDGRKKNSLLFILL